jgi:hypothetical protein
MSAGELVADAYDQIDQARAELHAVSKENTYETIRLQRGIALSKVLLPHMSVSIDVSYLSGGLSRRSSTPTLLPS